MIALASIPAPPEWLTVVLTIPFGWLHGLLPFVAETAQVQVRGYAVIIIIGAAIAYIITSRWLTKRGAEPGITFDMALFTLVAGFIGARFFHVITHPTDYFQGQPWTESFAVWNGGLAIFGGIIFGAIGMLIGSRATGLRFWSFADAMVPGLLLAQALGRFGNYFNQELFGLPTDGWWGLVIDRPNAAIPVGLPDSTLFQPTFAYEVVWNALGVAVLLLARRQGGMQWGKLTGLYLIWYGAGRIVWENIRIDPSVVFLGVRVNVWAAIGAVVLGLVIIIVQTVRHKGAEPSPYRPGREWVPVSPVDSDETYSDSDDQGDEAPSTTSEAATSDQPVTT